MSNVDINVDRRTDGLTDGRTDGQKIGRLYRTLLQAGAIKILIKAIIILYTASYRKPQIKTSCSGQGIRNNIIFSPDTPDVKIVSL